MSSFPVNIALVPDSVLQQKAITASKTLGSLNSLFTLEDGASELLPRIDTFTGNFKSIGIFESGSHGTCIRRIAEIPLTGAQTP